MTPVNQILRDVRVAAGLNPTAAQSLIFSDEQLTTDQRIIASLTEAVAQAHLEAPAHWLVNASSFAPTEPSAITWDATEPYGSLSIPADWLRLVSYQMTDWLVPVLEPITADSPLYAQQRSPYAGVRGTPERPVCAITPDRRLEFYSCRTKNAGIAHALYMPMPAIVDNSIDIAPRCYQRVVDFLVLQLAK